MGLPNFSAKKSVKSESRVMMKKTNKETIKATDDKIRKINKLRSIWNKVF